MEAYKQKINNKEDIGGYEFTKEGVTYRIEVDIHTYYDEWNDNRSLKLYFRLLRKDPGIDGCLTELWLYDYADMSLGEMNELVRNRFPDEVQILKNKLGEHIKTI